jgi:hypothetical protein
VSQGLVEELSRTEMRFLLVRIKVDNRNVAMIISLKEELIVLCYSEVIDREIQFALLK